jgi:uncharacterized protein DUF4159
MSSIRLHGPVGRSAWVLAAALALGAAIVAGAPRDPPPPVPDPPQPGGEAQGIVQVANLIYAGTKTSKCFSDHFLLKAEGDSTISTSRRLHVVKLSSEEIFSFPLLIMTGEGQFTLTDEERANLKAYLENGGFLLASAGCSSPAWDRSFRAEVAAILPDHAMSALKMDHALFHTVYDIERLDAKTGEPRPLEGIHIEGRLAVIYSQDGLNDTAHSHGCCCCGGNEITNSEQVNVNILAYCLIY